MSKNKKQHPNEIKGEELDINGNPVDPNREYIGNKVKVPMVSQNCSIYKTPAIIILKGKSITSEDKKKAKFFELLNKAPISFSNNKD